MSEHFRVFRTQASALSRSSARWWPLPSPSASCVLREPAPNDLALEAVSTPDLDGVWKQALQTWLPDCLALFWPKIHQRIDWRVAPIFLDQELRRLDRILKRGEKRVDVLVQVRLKSGGEALLLIHLEVQAGRIGVAFRTRMFRYRIRLYERYPKHTILSCAILLDRENGSTTETFQSGGLGDELTFRFPVVNLTRWRRRLPTLEKLAPVNPFAVIVMAYLRYRATRPDITRLAGKLQLARSLAQWGYDDEARGALFFLIDSLLVLPEPLDELFTDTLEEAEDPIMMQQLTSVQRVLLRRQKAALVEAGRQEGRQEGKFEGAALVLQSQLQQKFGSLPDWALTRLAQADTEALQQWALNVLQAERLEAVFGD
ncbi:MAG: hypothetical protein M0R28_18820 [Pigmentiphaga sp.]|nr:hypothetical protein [Pigmentiphaga sp.]